MIILNQNKILQFETKSTASTKKKNKVRINVFQKNKNTIEENNKTPEDAEIMTDVDSINNPYQNNFGQGQQDKDYSNDQAASASTPPISQ